MTASAVSCGWAVGDHQPSSTLITTQKKQLNSQNQMLAKLGLRAGWPVRSKPIAGRMRALSQQRGPIGLARILLRPQKAVISTLFSLCWLMGRMSTPQMYTAPLLCTTQHAKVMRPSCSSCCNQGRILPWLTARAGLPSFLQQSGTGRGGATQHAGDVAHAALRAVDLGDR